MLGWGALAALAGIALGYGAATGSIGLPLWTTLLMGVAACLVAGRLAANSTLATVCCLLLAAGIVRGTSSATPSLTAGDVGFYAGRVVTLTGSVAAEPNVQDSGTLLSVAVHALALHGQAARGAHGLVVVRYAGSPPVAYGDVLTLTGRLESLASVAAPGYRAYLRAQGVGATLAYPRMARVSHGGGSLLGSAVARLRLALEAMLRAMVPQPEANLLIALLLGGHSSSLGRVVPDFIATGMIHVVATSGLKVTLVVGLILRLSLRLWGPSWAFLATLPATAAYVALTGGTPAGLRAGLMWTMVLVAPRLGRRAHALTSLALTAAGLVLLSPSLVADVGFQMSVLGTAGVIGLAAPLETRLHRLPAILREGLAVTLAAQVATLPVVAGAFGQISLVGPLANALCVPLMAVAMATGAAGALVTLVIPVLAHVAGWPAYAALWAMISIVHGLSALPAAALSTPPFPVLVGAAYYVLVLLGAWSLLPEVPRPHAVALILPGRSTASSRPHPALPPHLAIVLAGGSLVLAVGWQAPPMGLYRVSFLPVGHGQSVVLQTPHGQVVIVDGGDGPGELRQALGTTLPFWRRTLTLALASATDQAHLGGLLGLTASYHVALAADAGSFYPGAGYARWRAELRQAGVRHLLSRRGARLVLDPRTAIDVLAPAVPLDPAAAAQPVAYRLWIGRVSILLVNRQSLDLPPQNWQADPSPWGDVPTRDTIVALPRVPQRGNAAWYLLAATHPALAVLPSPRDAAALGEQTGPLAIPPGTGETWQGEGPGHLDLLTDGQGYTLRAVP